MQHANLRNDVSFVLRRTCAKKTLIGHASEEEDAAQAHPPGGWPGSNSDIFGPDKASLSAGSEPHGDSGEGPIDCNAAGKPRLKSALYTCASASTLGWEEACRTGHPQDVPEACITGYPQDVQELALKTFSSDRSTFGVNAEQRRKLSYGCTVESGDEVCCVSGTPLEFMINAVDVFGENVVNRTQLDVIASKLWTHISVLGPHKGLRVRSFPEAHFRREHLYIVGTIRIMDPGNYKITVNIEMLGGQDQMLQPRNGVCVSVLSRRAAS
jgi:hypothetical protein